MLRNTSRLLLVLGLAACETATLPERDVAYDVTLPDGWVFHWVPDRLPVRYWVDPAAGPLVGYVDRGLAVWEGQFLYGEFRWERVALADDADVQIRLQGAAPPDVPLTDDPPAVGACSGVTRFNPIEDDHLVTAIPITLEWDEGYSETDVANCLYRVTVHELGHSLGLPHSPNQFDIMNATPRVSEPASPDRASLQTLYQTPLTLHPAERAP